MELQGIIPPMITPTDGDAVDHDRLGTFTERLVDAGVDGLLPVGSVGEFPSLTAEQRSDVVDTVVDHAGDCPVIAGCGGTSVRTVNRQLGRAADAGAAAGVVVTPYYFSPSQTGLCRFYRELAADAPLPILLYDIPAFTGVRLSPSSIAELAEEAGIVGLKDSTGDMVRLSTVLAEVPAEFTVLQGLPAIGFPSLEAGADGIIAGPANVFPATIVAWDRAYRQGNHARARELGQQVVMPTLRAKRGMPSPAAFKQLLDQAGFPVGGPLPPLEPLSADDRERLNACYDEAVETSLDGERWSRP